MNKLHSFNDYMLDIIIESISNDELELELSDRLKSLLKSINHPIASRLLIDSSEGEEKYKVTYLDIDDSKPKQKDQISFFQSNKLIDITKKEKGIERTTKLTDDELNNLKTDIYNNSNNNYKLKNRTTTSIGRVVQKLYKDDFKHSGDPGKDIESFVNMYKANRDTSDFEIVKGEDISYWYNENQYFGNSGPLNGSCMKYEKCKEYLDLYVNNDDKVSLLLLKSKDDKSKIRGRALLWELSTPSGRTFMDRIYYVDDSDIYLFKDYAAENGWIYKNNQNMNEDGDWTDSKTGEKIYYDLIVDDIDDPGDGHYPYCDTMKYFDGDTISNSLDSINSSDGKKLESTSGEYEGIGIYSDYYDEYINEDDMVWCNRGDGYRYEDDCYYSEYYAESIANDYAENIMYQLDYSEYYSDDYREEGDYITTYEDNICDEYYAENNFSYSQYHDIYVEESVYSEYHEDNLPEGESVSVWVDAEQSNSDYRVDNSSEGNYWTWDYDDENYDDDVTEEELKEYNDVEED